MATLIEIQRPDTPEAVQLITELDTYLTPMYPQESRHGYSVDKLLQEGVAFFVMRQAGELAGCGGVKLFEFDYGEVKRMYVRPQFRGLGLGKRMLAHLAGYASQQGVGLLRLETGIYQTAAIHLYERYGFRRIPPFGNYREDPLSLYYEFNLPRYSRNTENTK
jgi:ribosomal protein S18 acetylase RimI-like enzyme